MPRTSRPDLPSFASALAQQLPGDWSSDYLSHSTYPDQCPRSGNVWDLAMVHGAISTYVLGHDAILAGPDDMRLYVIERPLHDHQMLVAAFAPSGIEDRHLSRVAPPNGIAVHPDPVRAASQVSRRLLPRYRQAAAQARQVAAETPASPLAPQRIDNQVSVTCHANGALAATSCDRNAATVLYLNGFQYDPYEEVFLLQGYDPAEQVRRIQETAHQLGARGIGLAVLHAPPSQPPLPAPSVASTPTPTSTHAVPRR
ncbi:hypothetical protein ACWCXK_05970 [Streptomyces sp. NPDC001739]